MEMCGKVEMTLKEYDALKQELLLYKDIVDAVTTLNITDWDINWFKDHADSYLYFNTGDIYSSLHKDSAKLLRSIVKSKVDAFLDEHGLEGKIVYSEPASMNLGHLCHEKEEE